jgi:hypothetical protein
VRVRFDRVAGRHVVVPSADSAPREALLDTPPRLRDSRHWNGMQTALLLRRIDRVLDKAVAMTNGGGLTSPADHSLGSTSAPAQTAYHLVQSAAPRPTSATLPAGLLCLDVKALPKVPKQNQSSAVATTRADSRFAACDDPPGREQPGTSAATIGGNVWRAPPPRRFMG